MRATTSGKRQRTSLTDAVSDGPAGDAGDGDEGDGGGDESLEVHGCGDWGGFRGGWSGGWTQEQRERRGAQGLYAGTMIGFRYQAWGLGTCHQTKPGDYLKLEA